MEYQEQGRPAPTVILIDTSPDLREQLLDANVTRLDAVLYTHDHADQTHGIDDLRALVLLARKRLPVFMDAKTRAQLTARFSYVFTNQTGYPALLDAQPDFEALRPFGIEGPGGVLECLPLLQDHGAVESYGFRFGAVAYSNDVVRLSEPTLEALSGLDLWIVDALRYTPHPTHATIEQALEWTRRLRPKRTVLTNLHIDLDYQRLRAELPPGVEPGYDGMRLTVPV